jgi:dTDP-4-amino-4,6-dideoxygalactose transaminase
MEPLLEIARRHNLYVVEDACQAIGATYTFSDGTVRMAGTMGHIGCTSFFPSKNLGCFGDGGALFIQDEKLAGEAACIANHGSVQKYHHERIGINSRLDSLQAALLNVKLRYLDEYIRARQTAAAKYNQLLAGCDQLTVPQVAPHSTHVYHQYTLRLANSVDRVQVQAELKAAGIPSMVYYPVSLHLQPAFAFLGHQRGDFPVAEHLADTVLSLPMHTELTDEMQETVAKALLAAVNKG